MAQLAGLANPEARTILVTPYDKGALRDIEQAIRDTPNLGANPTNDGNIVRVTLPELTEERRKEYVKLAKTKAEDGKITLRNLRRKAKESLDALKSEVGDDEVVRGAGGTAEQLEAFVHGEGIALGGVVADGDAQAARIRIRELKEEDV